MYGAPLLAAWPSMICKQCVPIKFLWIPSSEPSRQCLLLSITGKVDNKIYLPMYCGYAGEDSGVITLICLGFEEDDKQWVRIC